MLRMRMHYAMTGMLAASLALVMVLIIVLDWPFRGTVSVTAEPFAAVAENIKQQLEAQRWAAPGLSPVAIGRAPAARPCCTAGAAPSCWRLPAARTSTSSPC